MEIDLMKKPENKTEFENGDVLGYEGSPIKFMVVGEDDTYLHTFILGSGSYWGVFKKEENLSCLIKHKINKIKHKIILSHKALEELKMTEYQFEYESPPISEIVKMKIIEVESIDVALQEFRQVHNISGEIFSIIEI